jgi:hypothetical protein
VTFAAIGHAVGTVRVPDAVELTLEHGGKTARFGIEYSGAPPDRNGL